MKRIFVFAIVLLVPFIVFAASDVSSSTDSAPENAASLTVNWTIDVDKLSGYKIGFTNTEQSDIKYDGTIQNFSGPLNLTTKIGVDDSSGNKQYYGEGSVYVYWQIRSSKNIRLFIYTGGQMKKNSTPTLDWTISWDSDKEATHDTISDKDPQAEATNLLLDVKSDGVIKDTCGTTLLNIKTAETTVASGDVYEGMIYLKAVNYQ